MMTCCTPAEPMHVDKMDEGGACAGDDSDTAMKKENVAPQSNGVAPAAHHHHHEGFSPSGIRGAAAERKDAPAGGPPQAVVRPQILTHVLGDFVIQESSEPFPVGRFHSNEPQQRNGPTSKSDAIFKQETEPPSQFFHIFFLR